MSFFYTIPAKPKWHKINLVSVILRFSIGITPKMTGFWPPPRKFAKPEWHKPPKIVGLKSYCFCVIFGLKPGEISWTDFSLEPRECVLPCQIVTRSHTPCSMGGGWNFIETFLISWCVWPSPRPRPIDAPRNGSPSLLSWMLVRNGAPPYWVDFRFQTLGLKILF